MTQFLGLLTLGLVSLALGLSAVLLSLHWPGPKWWLARKEARRIDAEWDHHEERFGSDGLWFS